MNSDTSCTEFAHSPRQLGNYRVTSFSTNSTRSGYLICVSFVDSMGLRLNEISWRPPRKCSKIGHGRRSRSGSCLVKWNIKLSRLWFLMSSSKLCKTFRHLGHYVDKTPIPDDLLKKLMKSRIANAGAFNLRQIILGTADQRWEKYPVPGKWLIWSRLISN